VNEEKKKEDGENEEKKKKDLKEMMKGIQSHMLDSTHV